MSHSEEKKEESNDGVGPLVTQAYVCKEKGAKLVLEDITLPSLTATQVQLDNTLWVSRYIDQCQCISIREYILCHYICIIDI